MKIFSFFLIWTLLIISACGSNINENSKSINNFLPQKENEKIELTDGKSGNMIVINEEKKVKEFLLLFEDIRFQKIEQDQIKGFQYLVNIGKTRILIQDKNIVKIDNVYYITNKDIQLNKIKEDFLKDQS